jgi:hypothetical protein
METDMRSFKLSHPRLSIAMMRTLTVLGGAAVAVALILASSANAQQPAKKKVPTLNTDDVIRSAPATEENAKETPIAEDTAKAPVAPAAAKGQKIEDKTSPEESAWRERVTNARQAADHTQRAAEEGELRITSLRNDLNTSGQNARFRNETAAQLDQAGQQLNDLRAAARDAKKDLDQLLDYGKEKGFTEAPDPKPAAEDGKPNEKYYTGKAEKLMRDLQDAQRREQLYQNRLNDISQRMLNASRNGLDGFTMAQLQQDRQEIQSNLDDARAALTKAQNAIDTLREEARRAGVDPGIFR